MAVSMGNVETAARGAAKATFEFVSDAGPKAIDQFIPGVEHVTDAAAKSQFKLHDWRSIESMMERMGPAPGPMFIKFDNGSIKHVEVVRGVEQVAVETKGFLGRKSTEMVDRPTYRFIDKPAPSIPPLPSRADKLGGMLQRMTTQANDLQQRAGKLGQMQKLNVQKAVRAQDEAKVFLNHARDFLRAGDKDSAVDALARVVSATEKVGGFTEVADVLAHEKSALMQQVAEFRSGLEKAANKVEVTGARIEGAQVANDVKKQVTGLGAEAASFKSEMEGMMSDLDNLLADNAAMDDAVKNGEIDTIFGSGIETKANAANQQLGIKDLLDQLTAEIATEARTTETTAATSAVGVHADEAVATEVKSMEL